MATIWDRVIKKVVGSVVEQELKKADIERNREIEKGIQTQQISGLGFPTTPGGNVVSRLTPGIIRFSTLRQFSVYYPILRACINFRKRQMGALSWDIASREVVTTEEEKKSHRKDADTVKEFLTYPTGDKTSSFRNLVNKMCEDLLVLDACVLYRRKNRKGGLYGYLPIDASTIELILSTDGTIPLPPQDAYVQKIAGRETGRYTVDDLVYFMLNPRTNTPYGLSPVETLIITVSTALKLAGYNLAYLTEGNVPEGFVQLPKDVASNPDQLTQWQQAWDAMMSGNPQYQRKIKFLPEGMKYDAIRKPTDMQFESFDKWLLLQTCAVMEVPPQAIGFQFDRGKGATESEIETGRVRGLFPMAHTLKEVFDQMIQEDLGMKHLEFVWTNINPTDRKEEADVFKILVGTGAMSVDEWRINQGMNPIGLPQYIMTPIGPVLVSDFIANPKLFTNQAVGAATGGKPSPGGAPPEKAPEGGKPETTPKTEQAPVAPNAKPKDGETKKLDFEDQLKKMSDAQVVEELQRWRKAAINDLKQTRSFRDFKSDLIDSRTQSLIKSGLKSVKTKEELDDLFDPFITQESRVIKAVLDLYDDVNSIVENSDANPASPTS